MSKDDNRQFRSSRRTSQHPNEPDHNSTGGSNRFNRREFLKASSASALGVIGLSVSPLTSSVTAKSEPNGTDDVGITEQVEDLIIDGKLKKASNLLEKNNVRHGYDKQAIGSDAEINPQWNYTESNTSISIFLHNDHDDVWTAYGGVSFEDEDEQYSRGTPNNVADGCAIIFDSSEWSALQPSDEGVTYYDSAAENLSMTHDEYNPNYGPTAKVHHESAESYSGGVDMKTQLTRVDTGNNNIPVQFAYEHTYALLPLGGIDVSINLGALQVSLPVGASTAWKDETTDKPLS